MTNGPVLPGLLTDPGGERRRRRKIYYIYIH